MSVFNYVLPSGSAFVVRGPANATQAQADKIFYEQVAAGSLVGYESGQTLTSAATQITKFELSRLDRGTAGVDTPTVLAVIQGLPVIAGIPNLSSVPITDPINEADIVTIGGDDFALSGITADGTTVLSSYQVQKLLAQIANLVEQESDQISNNKGIGRFGFTAYALEQAGYVKPGTSLRFFAINSDDFVTVMNSPSVWTGKGGIYSLNDLLNDSALQNQIQVRLMQQGYNDLLSLGAIDQPKTSSAQISTGQVYTTGGLQTTRSLTATSLLSSTLATLNPTVRNAVLQSTNFNKLITTPNINLNTIGSGAVNSLTSGLSNLNVLNVASIGAGINNQITGSVGALVTNASKFGGQATALWAKSGGITGVSNLASTGLGSLGSTVSRLATGQLTNITGSLSGNLDGITKNLTNLVPGTLTNLNSSLDVFGKAGSFATNFANPLSNINNIGGLLTPGGGVGGALTGQLAGLSGALPSQLSGLTSAVGNLGSFANIGSVGALFGGGGDLVSGTAVAGGFNNTVNRSTVDAAIARVIGSSKVPLPTFQYPSLAALAPRLDIQQAQNFLQSQLRGVADGGIGQPAGAVRSLLG